MICPLGMVPEISYSPTSVIVIDSLLRVIFLLFTILEVEEGIVSVFEGIVEIEVLD